MLLVGPVERLSRQGLALTKIKTDGLSWQALVDAKLLASMDAVQIIAEPRRRELLRLCWSTERSAGDLAANVDITFGGVSQHLKVLRDAGLVTVRRDGVRRFYRANQAGLGPLAAYLDSLWSEQLDSLAELAATVERRPKPKKGPDSEKR
jgi:DNA-binding transcriptional ArsR family regulator